MNVTAAKISPLGKYVLTQIMYGDNGLDAFVRETGFDPREHLTEILAASAGNQQQGLVLGLGTFDVNKMIAGKGPALTAEQYNGATLVVMPGGKASHAVAFLGNSI